MNETTKKNLSDFIRGMSWDECCFFLAPYLNEYRFILRAYPFDNTDETCEIDDVMTIEEFNWVFDDKRPNKYILPKSC
jgi:hypothetical protein